MNKLYIVRHGQTLFNKIQRVQGWCDSPLTEKGINQACALGIGLQNVEFDAVYSSDLKRALDTTQLILEQNTHDTPEIKATKHLREAYYGSYEGGDEETAWGPVFEAYGYTRADVIPRFDEIASKLPAKESRDIIAANDPLQLAENFEQLAARFDAIKEEVLQSAGNTLIVCHGGAVMMLLNVLFPERNEAVEVENCSVSLVAFDDKEIKLVSFNDRSYLMQCEKV